jgi:hypothetical protein
MTQSQKRNSMKKILTSNKSKAIFRIVCTLIIIMAITAIKAHAQPTDPGNDPDNAPIDGGLSLLIAGGVGYGIKRAKEKRNKENNK